jgi:hypothetical protein
MMMFPIRASSAGVSAGVRTWSRTRRSSAARAGSARSSCCIFTCQAPLQSPLGVCITAAAGQQDLLPQVV